MKRWPTTAHSPRRWIWVSMRSDHSAPISARALSRPARLPISAVIVAVVARDRLAVLRKLAWVVFEPLLEDL